MPILPDLAGGYVLAHYGDSGQQSHIQKVHLEPFDATTLVFTRPPDVGSFGTPIDIPAWLVLYEPILLGLMPNTYKVSSYEIYQIVAGVPTFVVTKPAVNPAATGTLADGVQSPANQYTFNFRTSANHAAKIVWLGTANKPAQRITDPSNPNVTALATFVIKNPAANTQRVVGHDGQPLTAFRSATSTLNRKLRRHYKLS